ncbi:tyrosinase family protein [Amaricoccus sp.]|uniref:tyrosinase family protein n=1 Tax=Amaricoccus sp. TaxID=1872485 RepID=UPI001B5BA250|nr:tyrosinase family protein [Amaricoccus sp.]MBP7242386.1 tyrosinase family protein [Amaricoccus sp.]
MIRCFLATVLYAAVLVLSLAGAAAAGERKNINALTADELEGLRRGVATMKARDTAARNTSSWRRSWLFWANLHGHFGSDCDGPVTGDGMSGVTTWEAGNNAERRTWCTCQHHNAGFLPWHRIAVYHFEKVLQQAAGMPALSLPYWDYSADPALPAAFRDPTYVNAEGQTVANPLYVANRNAAINAGTGGISSSARSADNAMATSSYNTFRNRLESTPHGSVHCALSVSGCPSGYMGSVSAAALDPIFWLHHANIDRLYDCWTRSGTNTRLPTGSILNVSYSFPSATGQVVSMRVRDGLTPTQLGYNYTTASYCSGVIAEATSPGPLTAPTMVAGGFEGATGMISPELERAAEAGATLWLAQNRPRATLPTEAQSRRGRPSLRLENVVADSMDPGMYEVYMVAPDGRRAFLGNMTFFAEKGDTSGAPAGHAGHATAGGEGQTFDYDLSGPARELGLRPGSEFEIAFVPTTGVEPLPGASARAGQAATAVERRGASPRIGRVRVQVE